ncbi:MAG TPA: hypothetical protein ENK20_09780 [Chromatiales bacterium]|nr:hypothetical protein [Chromatiales bacterium]
MMRVRKRNSRRAGILPAAALALAAGGGLGGGAAQAAPWPHDDLVLEVPVDIRNYSSSFGGPGSLTTPGSPPRDPRRVPVTVVCKVYRGGYDVAEARARAELRNDTPIPEGRGGPLLTPYRVHYRPLQTVLQVRFRNVRGVERYRCELLIEGSKHCGGGQTCEVRGELPAQVTGPAARAAGEAARKGARGLDGIRGGGGFAPGR